MPRIEETALPESVAADYTAEPPFNSLMGIGRLNAFVGPNNSGKSRLLRELFLAGQDLLISTDDEDARRVRDSVRAAKREAEGLTRHRALREKVAEVLDGKFLGFHPCTRLHSIRSEDPSKVGVVADGFTRRQLSGVNSEELTRCDSIHKFLTQIQQGLQQLYNRQRPQGSPPREPEPLFTRHSLFMSRRCGECGWGMRMQT